MAAGLLAPEERVWRPFFLELLDVVAPVLSRAVVDEFAPWLPALGAVVATPEFGSVIVPPRLPVAPQAGPEELLPDAPDDGEDPPEPVD